MRSLLRYFIRNYGFILFLFLEIISFVLLFNFNNYQKVKFLNSANSITASVYNSYNSVVNYFSLAKVNNQLAADNAKLKSELYSELNSLTATQSNRISEIDSVFSYTSARVINNSVNKQLNYITLNKGRKDGIKPDQAIISTDGVVGVVTHVSESYSMGLSLLNKRWSISAKLKNSGFYGSLSWNGSDFRYADLLEIPFHIELQHGDTIVTSGYSSIFPEGILIGTIQSFEQPQGENYFKITVKLSTNFKAVTYVEVVENRKKEELENLNRSTQNDSGTN